VPVATVRSLSVVIVTVVISIVLVTVRHNLAKKNNKKRSAVINPQPKESPVMPHVSGIIASGKNKK
jgi:uncharacterized membrane protein SirB2